MTLFSSHGCISWYFLTSVSLNHVDFNQPIMLLLLLLLLFTRVAYYVMSMVYSFRVDIMRRVIGGLLPIRNESKLLFFEYRIIAIFIICSNKLINYRAYSCYIKRNRRKVWRYATKWLIDVKHCWCCFVIANSVWHHVDVGYWFRIERAASRVLSEIRLSGRRELGRWGERARYTYAAVVF